jgi:hypothetical protein
MFVFSHSLAPEAAIRSDSGIGQLGWRAAHIRTTDEWLGGGLETGHCLKPYRVTSKLTFLIVPVNGKEPFDL